MTVRPSSRAPDTSKLLTEAVPPSAQRVPDVCCPTLRCGCPGWRWRKAAQARRGAARRSGGPCAAPPAARRPPARRRLTGPTGPTGRARRYASAGQQQRQRQICCAHAHAWGVAAVWGKRSETRVRGALSGLKSKSSHQGGPCQVFRATGVARHGSRGGRAGNGARHGRHARHARARAARAQLRVLRPWVLYRGRPYRWRVQRKCALPARQKSVRPGPPLPRPSPRSSSLMTDSTLRGVPVSGWAMRSSRRA